jgi:hypothetical protein
MTVLTILLSGEENVSDSILTRRYIIRAKSILAKRIIKAGILRSPKRLKSIFGVSIVKLSIMS